MRISDWSSDVCSSDLCLLGRSMHRIVECAREAGYLTDHRPFVADDEIDYLPRSEVLLLFPGSQGEPRAALWRVARGDWPNVGMARDAAAGSTPSTLTATPTATFALHNAVDRAVPERNT